MICYFIFKFISSEVKVTDRRRVEQKNFNFNFEALNGTGVSGLALPTAFYIF